MCEPGIVQSLTNVLSVIFTVYIQLLCEIAYAYKGMKASNQKLNVTEMTNNFEKIAQENL